MIDKSYQFTQQKHVYMSFKKQLRHSIIITILFCKASRMGTFDTQGAKTVRVKDGELSKEMAHTIIHPAPTNTHTAIHSTALACLFFTKPWLGKQYIVLILDSTKLKEVQISF